ncbi:MAG: hypothetical protein NTX85_02535 [Candidatus Nomurabacteria bacterium]|nr:hypothetical protein [Candidatus Nomurabacteria bacterium]
MINLSTQAIEELRIALQKSYGVDFACGLSDEEVNEIGNLLISSLAESLNVKIAKPEVSTVSM